MRKNKLFDEQIKRENDLLSIFLTTKAKKTALTLMEFIQARLAAGSPPEELEEQLLDDLLNNGRIFSEFRRAVTATASGSINRVRDIGYFTEMGVDKKYRWSAVITAVLKPCPDCNARHGQSLSWEEWEEKGLPRTGATVCRENCRCVLVPVEYSSIEPIKRERK